MAAQRLIQVSLNDLRIFLHSEFVSAHNVFPLMTFKDFKATTNTEPTGTIKLHSKH